MSSSNLFIFEANGNVLGNVILSIFNADGSVNSTQTQNVTANSTINFNIQVPSGGSFTINDSDLGSGDSKTGVFVPGRPSNDRCDSENCAGDDVPSKKVIDTAIKVLDKRSK